MSTLALLIDGDNAQLQYTEQIIQFCEVFGTLTIKKVYGDWKQSPLASRYQAMIDLGVEPVQQNRVGKNATDFGLAMDAALMLEKGDVGIYFIVSSDGDFTALCERIKQKGAKAIGIGSESQISNELRNACALFLDIDAIVKKQSKVLVKSPTPPKPKAAPPQAIVKKVSQPSAKAPVVPKPKTTPAQATVKKVIQPAAKATTAQPIAKKQNQPPMPQVKAAPAQAIIQKPSQPSPTVTVAPKPKPATVRKMLIRAYEKTPQQDGWVLLAQIGEALRKLDQEFKERFANKKLSNWFKAFPDTFEVANNRVRMKKAQP